MGKCTYCGEPAGWLRSMHPECRKVMHQRKGALTQNVLAIARAECKIPAGEVAKRLADDLSNLRTGKDFVADAWNQAVEVALDDDVLTEIEQHNLDVLYSVLSLDSSGNAIVGLGKMAKAVVIRDVMQGKLPSKQEYWTSNDFPLPFNFQKSEQLIWAFDDVDYYENKRRTRYEGGSRGVSVRVARGVYLRTGAFKGERIETMETILADTGILAITTKNLYFSGSNKGFRIRHDKIVSFEQFSDGIGILRDAVTATPQTFQTGDGWFTYNLLANAGDLQ